EKLFLSILIYSFLLLPIPVIFYFSKFKKENALAIGVYGIVFFLLLYFFYDVPLHLKQVYQYIYTFLEYSFFAFLLWSNIGNRRLRTIIIALSVLFAAF